MSVTHPEKRSYGSDISIDRVIYAAQKSYTPNNSIGTQTFTIPASETNTNQFGRPLGIFSTDSGATWNDMGDVSNTGSSLLNHATLPSLTVSAQCDGDGSATVVVNVNSTIGGGGTFSLVIGICILAVDSPAPLPVVPTLSGKTAYASRTKQGGSSQYREIKLASSLSTSLGTGQHIVPHNLGYIPDVQVWYGETYDYLQGSMMTAGAACALVDATNLYLYNWNIASNYLYRCYQP